ncbi:MAG TPA: formyltetrahydrofolate deformylase [Sphingobium sp.]
MTSASQAPAARDASYVLTVSCMDHPGLVAAVTMCLAQNGGNITEAQQFEDMLTGRFFMRIAFSLLGGASLTQLEGSFAEVSVEHALDWSISDTARRKRILLLASKFDHCLAELIYRWRTGDLAFDPVGIISNHPRETYAHLDFADVPFHHLPVAKGQKAAQEEQIKRIVEETAPDLVVLARYMQILSDDLAAYLSGRCINIHHSFLPGFKGAKPYHQAHARGVKLIGATAHFVTADLDEGPIIEQAVTRITHRDTPEDMVRKGRDVERMVLTRAVRAILEDRVLPNGSSTVVFWG